MKKYIFFIATLILGLASCDDYLTVTPPDQLTSSNYWRSKSDVESAMSAVYSQMYHASYTSDMWSFAEVKWPVEAYREDIVNMGNDAMNYPNWVDLYNFTYTNGNSQFTTWWTDYYRGINYANEVLDKMDGMSSDVLSDADRDTLSAEAHFMRAWYHMQLLLNWENIIDRDKYITSGEASALDKDVSPRTESWDFIISDLKEAENLPAEWDGDNVGRATRGAAYAYLGWAYLTRAYEEPDQKEEYLTEAVNAFNQVTGYELVSDFGSMFNGTNKNSKESIFELQFTLNDANGALYRTQFHRWIACSELWGWDEILPSETLMNEYMKEGEISTEGEYDARLYATIFYQCDHFNDGTGQVYGYDYDDWFNSDGVAYNRPAFRKLLPATYAALSLNATDVNIVQMRYANVLLMKAEALNGLGRTSEAIPLINEVRETHGKMPAMEGTTADEVQAQIEHERMLEFPLENFRWYDLRRWGKLASALTAAGRTGFSEEDNSFYPIPQYELNINGGITD
ncbi:MAG: RagB/SusD family nutrient uptake outer membrane protein [Prevotella sp.]|jgi:hypothetical protein